MINYFLATSLLALGITTTAHSAALNTFTHLTTPPAATTQQSFDVAYRPTGEEQLRRLLRPHSQYLPITQAVRDATGDPNIVVFDNRSPRNDVNRCSFLIYHGKRAMVCD